MNVRLLLAVMLTLAAVLVQPVADQAFGEVALRPNLLLAPIAVWVSLCPGAPAVVCCALIGLLVDGLSGPQLGARAACFGLWAALASMTFARQVETWLGRIALWGTLLFVAEMISRVIECTSVGGRLPIAVAASGAALSSASTTILLCGLWLAAQLVARGRRRRRSVSGFALASGRFGRGD
jgi:rod shape-determining protein MreD